jgi:hypothetical protein
MERVIREIPGITTTVTAMTNTATTMTNEGARPPVREKVESLRRDGIL